MRLALAHSPAWRLFGMVVATLAGVLFLEVEIPDSTLTTLPLPPAGVASPTARIVPGVRVTFSATAYCRGLVTSSGVNVRSGSLAADPDLLPAGSIIDLDTAPDSYDGLYTVLDTGPQIRGREVDIYMWNCDEAVRFGRRPAYITVIRLGWDPRATVPRPLTGPEAGRPSAAPAPSSVPPPGRLAPTERARG